MADVVAGGVLGLELGSTRIKACVIAEDGSTLATGVHEWENQLEGGVWTYSVESIWAGVQACYAAVVTDVVDRFGQAPTSYRAIGVSAMMHGYLAFDAEGELLVPFRTWRNTSTGTAAAELSAALGHNVPLRWSVAHLYQAILNDEAHVPQVSSLTTLAGYVHQQLTGRRVLGVGDASGMFPIDATTGTYDARMLDQFDQLVAQRQPDLRLEGLLPEVLRAGATAGLLTRKGAALLDPSGQLQPGVPLCPPEGDAGTGMVATNSLSPRSANVSVGTSIFAMVVLDRPLAHAHEELDIVMTPAGLPVAMVHCNNGASELGAWTELFTEFASALGADVTRDDVFRILLTRAVSADSDAGGVLAYNYVSGEPITGLVEGRPLVVRSPGSSLTLANFMRAQLFSAFATLSIGMRVLTLEGIELDSVFAHGGLFRTEGVAPRLLAAALDAPVSVGATPGEGGAWGAAVLAGYLAHAEDLDLVSYLARHVFADAELTTVVPDAADALGFGRFLGAYTAGLEIERAAVRAL